MIEQFDALWEATRPAFAQARTWRRARTLAFSALARLGRHTVTGLLTTSGQQFADWSAAYRLFEHQRFVTDKLFAPARRAVGEALQPGQPFVALLDDTLFRKRGKKVHGAAWRRDPLGPPFQCNLVWAQRFVPISAALPERNGPSRARAIPIDLQHCPTPRRPRKNAPAQQWDAYRRAKREPPLSRYAVDRLKRLRHELDAQTPTRHRTLLVATDARFTNRTILRNRPGRTHLIGRVRKDAKRHAFQIKTDPSLALAHALQAYLWRIEIELNFRDEKTLLGAGEAQVRTPHAVAGVPALVVAAYAFLLLAIHRAHGTDTSAALPRPKWYRPTPNDRLSTAQAIALLRSALWRHALHPENFSHFTHPPQLQPNPSKIPNPLTSAVLYAFR